MYPTGFRPEKFSQEADLLCTNAHGMRFAKRRRDGGPDVSNSKGNSSASATLAPSDIGEQIKNLGKWFHNLDLQGVNTAPDHFLGDYPAVKWKKFAHAIPSDLRGKTVLDIGCNAGFYSIEMKRRGAERVVGIDSEPRYLAQARFASQVSGVEIEFHQLSVYDVASLNETFDIVLFMGVLYHLRHPLLALDLIHAHAACDLLVFQTLQRGDSALEPFDNDYDFWETKIFDHSCYPRLHFVEHRYSGDLTNWWIPNRACSEAMLRSAGFEIQNHPEDEVYICRRVEKEWTPGDYCVYPTRPGANND
jgi:tRNA (mo5U34)-methyltransferase